MIKVTTIPRSDYSSPCVYQFMLDYETLYIGSSKNGYTRVFDSSKNKKHGPRLKAFKMATAVRVTTFDTIEEARQSEENNGPVCAKKYALPWDAAKESKAIRKEIAQAIQSNVDQTERLLEQSVLNNLMGAK